MMIVRSLLANWLKQAEQILDGQLNFTTPTVMSWMMRP